MKNSRPRKFLRGRLSLIVIQSGGEKSPHYFMCHFERRRQQQPKNLCIKNACRGLVALKIILHVKAEQHHVAVLYNVVLAL